MANWLAVLLNAQLILDNIHRIEDPITDNLVNLLDFLMTDDPSIPMILPKATNPGYGIVAYDW